MTADSEPTPAELDRWAAEMMGWRLNKRGQYRNANGVLVSHIDNWHPSTDPGDDYRVLEWCQNNLEDEDWSEFVIAVGLALNAPADVWFHSLVRNYKPGDWTRAAVAVRKSRTPTAKEKR